MTAIGPFMQGAAFSGGEGRCEARSKVLDMRRDSPGGLERISADGTGAIGSRRHGWTMK